jgi:carbon monoxide dehydrogenase subunit G
MAVIVKLSSSFTVPAAADKVVALFLDPQTMRSCIPGCEELVQIDESHYKGTLVNEVAHVRFKAGFTAEIVSVSEAADEPAVVRAVLRGEDRRLGSTIRMDAALRVSPVTSSDAVDTSEVDYEFELAIRGKLGRLGESVIRRRTAEVERQFAEALTAVCSGRPLPQRSADVPGGVKRDDAVTSAAQPEAFASPSSASERGPVAAPPRQDRLVLGFAVAAAFAYGILVGERIGGRR